MSDKIYVFDTTLRDGEQVPGCQLTTNEKVEIAKELELLGVDVIEAGFPVSSPGDFQSVREISKAVSDPIICALTRSVQKDIEVAADALKYAKRGRIHTGIGASDFHIKHKFNSTRDLIVERAVKATKFARNLIDDVEFYCEDAGRADNEFLVRMVESVIAAGATVVNIPDTTGYCLPEDYGNKIAYLMNNVPNIDQAIISVHCHNDLGMATANTIAGIQNGARQVEVTMNGIGERAGNTSLEEIVMVLKTHQKMGYHTDIDAKKIYLLSLLVSKMMRMPIQANKAIVGRNAFAHSSGIHQDGVLKNKDNYEIIAPEDVGVPSNSIILTARSGKAALNYHLKRLGYFVEKDELAKIYVQFLELADSNTNIQDEDLIKLMGGKIVDTNIEIKEVKVICGNIVKPTANVELIIQGENVWASATGNGPINASLRAVDKIIKEKIDLDEFLVQAMSKGSSDTGKVHIRVDHKGRHYYGFGVDEDIVLASVKAYVAAINKMAFLKKAKPQRARATVAK